MHARPCWRHASAELFAPQRPCRWSGGMGPSRLGTCCVWARAHVLAARDACRRVVVGAGGRGSRAAGPFAWLSSMRKGAGLRRRLKQDAVILKEVLAGRPLQQGHQVGLHGGGSRLQQLQHAQIKGLGGCLVTCAPALRWLAHMPFSSSARACAAKRNSCAAAKADNLPPRYAAARRSWVGHSVAINAT